MKTLTFVATLILVMLPFYAQLEEAIPANVHKIKTVIIDAGHGGKDSGSLGATAQEKNIALKIALQVGNYIKTYMPGVKVVYTRDSDKFVPLFERADIANRHKAQVFISIHCNSLPPKKSAINGTETYVLGLHRAEDNLEVAKRENEVILLEDNYKKHYDGFDPNSAEAHIMLSMYQNAYLGQSILLAEKMEFQFKNRTKRASRGVKQAGFVVLRATSMPSVLVETGFLSNKTEEQYLNSEKGQIYLASAIYRAFKEYKDQIEQSPSSSSQDPNEPVLPPSKQTAPTPTPTPTPKTSNSNAVVYKVQLASSPIKLDTKTGAWKKVTDLEVQTLNGQYKYLSGSHHNLKDAASKQAHWRQNGFPDAFIVAYQGSERISLSKARELTGN